MITLYIYIVSLSIAKLTNFDKTGKL